MQNTTQNLPQSSAILQAYFNLLSPGTRDAYRADIRQFETYFRELAEKELNKKDISLDNINNRKPFKGNVYIYKSSTEDNQRFTLHLSVKLKKQILLNNIHGVDIDNQAVEVTKFSLSVKSIENLIPSDIERRELLADSGNDREKVLPELRNNIKCGNSLIGTDYYDLFGFEDSDNINPFNWKKEFEEIIDYGGFDVVIGNPPYIDIKGLDNSIVEYVFSNYSYSNNGCV